jgi:hypothetical protein
MMNQMWSCVASTTAKKKRLFFVEDAGPFFLQWKEAMPTSEEEQQLGTPRI